MISFGCLGAVDSDDASAKLWVTNLFPSLSVVKIRKLGLVILGVSDQFFLGVLTVQALMCSEVEKVRGVLKTLGPQ